MTEGVLNLHYHNGESAGSVKVKLKQDVPDEMMELLITNIKTVVEKWQDKVIMHRKCITSNSIAK